MSTTRYEGSLNKKGLRLSAEEFSSDITMSCYEGSLNKKGLRLIVPVLECPGTRLRRFPEQKGIATLLEIRLQALFHEEVTKVP